MFSRALIIPITVQFDNNRFKNIDIKICSLTEMTDEEEEGGNSAAKKRKVRKTTAANAMTTQAARNKLINAVTPYMVVKQSRCSMSIGKITMVQITGEYASRIHDNTRMDDFLNVDPNRPTQTVSLYEDTIYQLHVQFECGGQLGRDLYGNVCDFSQDVNVWIDFNDNDYDDGESRVPRTSSDSYLSGGTHDYEIHVPAIDDRNTKNGVHRMRLTVIPSEEYLRDCRPVDYNETREYTVNIVPKTRYAAPVVIDRRPPPVVDRRPANIVYRDPVCDLNAGKIVLVILVGERGTQIRDDLPPNALVNDYQNRHHMAATIYEHTVYLLRIQLDCSWQLNTELFEHGCNLAQDVNVWIDMNDDGRFDESEIGAPYRWPLTSYMPEGIYDMQIYVPLIDGRYMKTGQHRMRIVVMPNDKYQRQCGRIDYNETREYTINIISRSSYLTPYDVTPSYRALSEIICSSHVGKIVHVIMAGEHRTQIRDDPTTRELLRENDYNQKHLSVVLFQGIVYLIRIQLDCGLQRSRDSYEYNCNLAYDVNVWIDANDDGIFSDSENVSPFRWPVTSYTPQGVYDLQLSIPTIDGIQTKTGPHRMRLVVMLDEQYRRKCGDNDHRETREYTVTIVPYTRLSTEIGVPYLSLREDACSLTNGKIALVIMAGEQGTHIRDDISANTVLSENQNRHHLAVSLNENIVYRIRIHLKCFVGTSRSSYDHNCNLAQDVNIWIDLNNDGRYDESESHIPRRWPLHSSMALGIYDLEIQVPAIDRLITRSNSHTMRVVVKPSEEYNRKCGKTDYTETRDYTINIIPRTAHIEPHYRYTPEPVGYLVPEPQYRYTPVPVDYLVPAPQYRYTPEPAGYVLPAPRVPHCPPGNLACSDDNDGISLVTLYGEQGSQIRDELRQCNSANNYNDRSDQVVTLFDGKVYTLNVALYCVQQQQQYDPSFYGTSCTHAQYIDVWIDFNNDGEFDENKERIISNDWYRDGNRKNEYELTIVMPRIDGRYYLSGHHRMRVILSQDERSRKACYNIGYGEARDYTVQIVSQSVY